jgi:hypothetical protein
MSGMGVHSYSGHYGNLMPVSGLRSNCTSIEFWGLHYSGTVLTISPVSSLSELPWSVKPRIRNAFLVQLFKHV